MSQIVRIGRAMVSRSGLIALLLLATACVTHRDRVVRYDFDSIHDLSDPNVRLNATIAIPEVTAPSWLRTDGLMYRLDFVSRSRPEAAYALSEWAAPPAELLTQRLRELIAAANAGFTVRRSLNDREGYRVDVGLERFEQVFSSPHESHCVVTLSATLTGSGARILAQRTFQVERPAPSADAAGGVYGLVQASDAALDQILGWTSASLGRQRGAHDPD